MTDMSPESKALLEAARAAEPRPTPADKARIKALVAAGITSLPAGAEAASAGAKSAGASGTAGASLGLKIGGAVLAAGLSVTAYFSLESEPVVAPPPKVEQEVKVEPQVPVKMEEGPEAFPPEPAPDVRRTKAPAAPKPKAPKVAPRPQPTSAALLAEEAALIKAAKKAVAGGRFDDALDLVSRHEEKFAAGELRVERRAVKAMALCGAGRPREGRAILDALDPEAPYRAGIERACEE